MTFFAFGLNHESVPMQVRETYALSEAAQRRLYETLALSDEAELILLSTCNRTEAYLFGEEQDVAAVKEALCREAGRSWPDDGFLLEDEDAVRHILEVACGLRSLVLGETQILGQVKEAYRRAVEADRVDTLLHRLMHTTFRTAKRVVQETELTDGAASVSSAAVAMARAFFEERHPNGLTGRRALLLGTGKMGRLALKALQEHDLARLAITNRTSEHADPTARSFDAEGVAWESRHEAVRQADLVIVATGADEPVLRAESMEASDADETLLLDIAVPRNVEPAVGELPGYAVFDLDALNERLVRVEAQRRAAVPAAREIVDDVLSDFVSWFFHQQALQPAIHAIRDTFERIRQREIDRHAHRLADTDRVELDRLTRSILQKVLAIPIVQLKDTDPESIDFVRGIKLLNTLFSRPGCEDESAKDEDTLPEEEQSCPFDASQGLDDTSLREELELYQELRTARRD